VLIIGTDDTARRLAAEVAKSDAGIHEVVGFVGDPMQYGLHAKRYLGCIEDIPTLIQNHSIDEVIVSDPMCWHKRLVEETLSTRPNTLDVKVVPTAYEAMLGLLPFRTINDIPTVSLGRQKRPGFYQRFKSIVDKTFAALLLLITCPILICVLLATKLTSKGAAIYKQERVGRGGKSFTLYKVRTMVDKAESVSGPTLSWKNDHRVTMIGRILRKSKLDELPQLINVLKGQMSLVGPRPERPCFVQEFDAKVPCYMERHRVRPGITGLAQVCGNYSTTPDVKIRYDLMYVYNQSLWLDIKIIALTVKAIIREFHPGPKQKRRQFRVRSRRLRLKLSNQV
jgi:exopolysaccharide biosynthesis polyprenyl glycosylphosphotransferase